MRVRHINPVFEFEDPGLRRVLSRDKRQREKSSAGSPKQLHGGGRREEEGRGLNLFFSFFGNRSTKTLANQELGLNHATVSLTILK